MNILQNNEFLKHSEMDEREREFLLEAIKSRKPKNILEVGIAAGANSAMILDFLEQENLLSSTKFHCIDYSEQYYRDINSNSPRKTGFLVETLLPHLSPFYNLHTGGFASKHLPQIYRDDKIDFVIIDTVHVAPGEALDFLMVYPYLAKNAVVVFHDIGYHLMCDHLHRNVCALVFFALCGEKSIPKPYGEKSLGMQNIGLCELDDTNNNLGLAEYYFRLLGMPWYYMPNERDLGDFRDFIVAHYDAELVEYFDKILPYQKRQVEKFIYREYLSNGAIWRAKYKTKQFLKRNLSQDSIDKLKKIRNALR